MSRPLPLAAALAVLGLAACGATGPRGDDTPPPIASDIAGASQAAAAVPARPAEDLAVAGVAADAPAPALVAAPAPPSPPWPAAWPDCARTASCAFGLDAWLEAEGGWVNRFLVAGPITARALRRIDDPVKLAAQLGDTPAAVVSFSDPVIELAPHERLDKRAVRPVWLLRARVYSAEARDVLVEGGAVGTARVVLGGQTLLAGDQDQRLLVAAHGWPARLAAGWNELYVRLEKLSPYAVQLNLRVRAPDGGPVPGIAWDVPATAEPPEARSLCNALGLEMRQVATVDGFVLHGTSAPTGLVPAPRELTLGLRVAGAATPLASAPLDVASLATGAAAEVSATLPGARGVTRIELTVNDAPCVTAEVTPRPALQRRLVAAEGAIAALPEGVPDPVRDSLTFLAQRARARLEASSPHGALIGDDLDLLERLLPDAQAGRDPYATLTGVVTRAYRSRLDGELQRYVVLVPESYAKRGDAATPLVVAAHGLFYDPEDMVRIVTGKPMGPGATLARGLPEQFSFGDPDALIVADDGYGDAGQRPPGELDVLRVIEEVRRSYDVDPRRISLTGFSLGGSVAFWIPLHHPDLFSAAAPLCGYPNLEEYHSVQRIRKRQPWEEALLASEGIVQYAENGRYLPLRVVHGGKDNPRRSEVVVERYRALRFDVDFTVLEGEGHYIWDETYADGGLVKWLARQRRPETPTRPRLRTARYRWSKSDWLRLDRFARGGRFGELEGRLTRGELAVTTENVAAFSILVSELGDAAGTTRTLKVDGQKLGERALTGDLSFTRGEDRQWRLTDFPDAPPGHKRAGVEGPIRDIWYDPQVIVYGTEDPLQTEANRITALDMARYSPWIAAAAPVLRDVEATAEDLRGRHVVLIGNPASNRWTRRVAGELPVRFEEHALVFAGRRFEGDDVGISTAWPSPFDPDRTLVLHAGVGRAGTLSARYLPELAPDYLIYDSRLRTTWGDYLLGDRAVLAGGFYDGGWRP
ncbi:MAG: hypothetical protein CVU56_08700 [Deltaproteobacteria bacterium HGW-Deltaproteobacteria-14]|jgi:predicted esterase|nr:MAG: hypothetical protein CVU56_08700 [Deltaproteobacteria bacterium HGW-Deltaproteobacteria-14]